MDETAIEKYRSDLAFIRLAARQTEKDFARFGYELQLPEFPQSFRECQLLLEKELVRICRSDHNRLEGILYHIDIPEKVLHPMNCCRDPQLTADIIMQRELIKVVLKTIYSPQSPQ